MKIALSVPLLLFIPGYVIVSSFYDREKGRPALDFIEVCFPWVFVSSLVSSLLALILAELGRFSLLWLQRLPVFYSRGERLPEDRILLQTVQVVR